MGEHIGRYEQSAVSLVASGFAVLGNDHRGHGRAITASAPMGDFGEGGFVSLIADMRALSRYCMTLFPDVPLILLGHSMGSFAAQLYIVDDASDLAGAILSGCGALDQIAAAVVRDKAPLDGRLNAAFAPARTPFDWLTRDEAVVDTFIADPLCFPELTARAAESVLEVAPLLAEPNNLAKIRHYLPLLLLSGGLDPIGQQGQGVELLAQRYRAAGLVEVQKRIYEGARHELLNEINRAEVLNDLVKWIEVILDTRSG
jgi:alpha-beta hydrolase superfamily lysophospholipase